jgi:hypothetical protein
VADLAASLPTDAWQTIDWREGSRGAMCKQCAALRVHGATGSPVAGQSERGTQAQAATPAQYCRPACLLLSHALGPHLDPAILYPRL